MAGTFHVEVENDLRGCAILLKSVLCEWLLIFFLLVDAVYLYFLKKFAKYCNLQLPCMLCSRLDHIFGNEKPDFYKDLICHDHRSKLSSLVYCHNHGSLADVHDVCEECLLSFATKKDPSPEIYKFLIGKLGLDGLRNPVSESDFFHGLVSVKACSCCNKQWRCRPNVQNLVQTHSVGPLAPKPDSIPLPSTPREKHLNRRDAVVKARERISGTDASDSMAQVGYNKVKISSDTESDFVVSEEGDDGMREHSEYDKQGPGYSLKKQFDDCFTTKKVTSPTASDVPRQQTKQPDQLTSRPLKETQDSETASSLGQKLQPPSKSSLDTNQEDDKADGDAETWEAFDLITPKGVEGDDEDKKDGIGLHGFHTSKASALPPDQLARKDRNGVSKRANLSSTQTLVTSSDDKSDDVPFRFKVNGYKDIKVSQKSTSPEMSYKMEGDQNLITKLRKQIEEERECIERLRDELEEERSASAEAANQAMAMITKLQEEKAVLNMDAQQYLRMMEEQAEHDMDALERANDLLTEKEKEIQDLEAELEFYRMKYPDEYEEEFAQADLGMLGGRYMGLEGLPASNKDKFPAESS